MRGLQHGICHEPACPAQRELLPLEVKDQDRCAGYLQDDKTWAHIKEDEAEVIFEVAESIWDALLQDTAAMLLAVH